jgi:hypothetical protein
MRNGFSNSNSRLAPAALCWLAFAAGPAVSQVGEPLPAADLDFAIIAPLGNDRTLGYFVGGDNAAGDNAAGVEGSDAELCVWALNDWVRYSQGRLDIAPSPEAEAVIRIYFVAPGVGRYGEMRPIRVGEQRGAEVYVRTETGSLGPDIAAVAAADGLLRDTIVYLTCLHELGHALGMFHTAEFDDVMYYFGLGGDIPAFFGRYRSRLTGRDDIATTSGLSAGDIEQLLAAYPND